MNIQKAKILHICQKTFYYIKKLLQDIIAPPLCFFCRDFITQREVFCKQCYEMVRPIVSITLPITKKYKVKIFAISDYKDPIRSLILSKGYSDIVSSHKLGELIWEMTYIKNVDFDYLVPIPLHITRFATRGFNQAHEIASVLAQRSGKPVVNLLKRKKRTKKQSELTPENRLMNLKDAFSLNIRNTSDYKGKHLLIVDDLITTGATIKSASRRLIELKPRAITVVVACRVI